MVDSGRLLKERVMMPGRDKKNGRYETGRVLRDGSPGMS
jgi:hypothetical protein